jgi:molybdopterin/thiamine biosynthesis adenylyltransferase
MSLPNVARAPFARDLAAKRVAVVGCGALGWSVATALARAGVRDYRLYDPDVIHAENLPRLEARLSMVGLFKVDGLAAEIRSFSPDAQIESEPIHVGAGGISSSGLRRSHPELFVDATADDRSPPATNAAAIRSRRSALFAWTSPGVLAARIFRVVPGRTPCYECLRGSGLMPIRAATGSLGWSREFVWNGTGFNVDFVAAAATRMAVQTLLGRPVDVTNPDHIVLDFGRPVPIARTLMIARDPRCAVCA